MAVADDHGRGGSLMADTGAWQESTRGLLYFACLTRPDWTREETWSAIYAAKTAGLPWDRLVRRLLDIAFRVETPPTRPRELWDDARGVRDRVVPGQLDPEVRARLLADLAARGPVAGPRHGGGGDP